MPAPRFRKTIIGELNNAPADMNTFSAVGDINGDGRPDIALCGRQGTMAWFENPGRPDAPWTKHVIDQVQKQECGGTIIDLTGTGRSDIINGSDYAGDDIGWWENPGRSGVSWQRRAIATTGHGQFHDTLIGDITDYGVRSLLFTNQIGGTTIYRVPLPKDPRVTPWPGLEVIARELTEANPHKKEWIPNCRQPEEGLAIGDIDGDGRNELICGTHWYKWTGERWRQHKFAQGYITTKVAIGDVDGDGRNEIVLSEGDPCIYGKSAGGKLGYFKPGRDITSLWQETIIADGLLDAHTLQLGNLCGTGRLDIVIGEVGISNPKTDAYIQRPPRLMLYENMGDGSFERHIVDEGTGIHEGVLVDAFGTGRLDIIGKPLHGSEKWKLHVYVNEG